MSRLYQSSSGKRVVVAPNNCLKISCEAILMEKSYPKVKIFSDDIVTEAFAKQEPPSYLKLNSSTDEAIAKLYSTIEQLYSTEKAGILNASELVKLPFSKDLLPFVRDSATSSFSISDINGGLCRIAAHFLSRSEIVQARANAFVRCKLASAELIVNGMVITQPESSVERDQILLSSVSIPVTPRGHENGELFKQGSRSQFNSYVSDSEDNTTSQHPPPLFRSQSTKEEHILSNPEAVLVFDDETLSAIFSFFPELFNGKDSFSRTELSDYDASKLEEFFLFFDSSGSGRISRTDLLNGCMNIGRNFIALDEIIQLLANSYIQRKIRQALLAINNYCFEKQRSIRKLTRIDGSGTDMGSSTSSITNAAEFAPEELVVFTDAEGNRHVSTIIRKSQRRMEGQDAYYVVTKGVKLYVSVRRLSPVSAELDNVASGAEMQSVIDRQNRVVDETHAESKKEKALLRMNEDESSPTHREYRLSTQLSKFLDVPKDAAVETTPHSIEDTRRPSEEEKHQRESLHAVSVEPLPSADESLNSVDLLKAAVSDCEVPVAADAEPVGPEVLDDESVIAVPAQAIIRVEASLPAASATDATPTNGAVTDKSRQEQIEKMIQSDELLHAVVIRSVGKQCLLAASAVPRPKRVEPYPIYFNRGKNGFFEFFQVDYGIQYYSLLKPCLAGSDKEVQPFSDSYRETNRCFFLHFGIAMGLHPVAMQTAFRSAAVELLKYPENELTIFFGEALENLLVRNDFVDAQVLSAVWPTEFDKYKIMIVRVDHNGRIESFTTFRAENGPIDEFGEWRGDELVFTLQWNHFTILRPKSDKLTKPITAVLAAASMIGIYPLEFIVKTSESPKRVSIAQ